MIDENGAIALALAFRPIIHSEDSWRGHRRQRQRLYQVQEHIHLCRATDGLAQLGARRTTGNQADLGLDSRQPLGPASLGSGDGCQPFAEYSARTRGIVAPEAPHDDFQADRHVRPRQVRQLAAVVAMHTGASQRASGANGCSLNRLHAQTDRRAILVDVDLAAPDDSRINQDACG